MAELLVVLLIITLLISILVPVVTSARTRARATTCKSNLRTIGQALTMYLNENKDRFPVAPALPTVNPWNHRTIMDHLRPYLTKAPETDPVMVFQCPSDDELFPVERTSYLYYAELGVRPVEENWAYQVFKTKQYVPSLLDAGDYHGRALPIHCLFLDGRVEQVARPKGAP